MSSSAAQPEAERGGWNNLCGFCPCGRYASFRRARRRVVRATKATNWIESEGEREKASERERERERERMDDAEVEGDVRKRTPLFLKVKLFFFSENTRSLASRALFTHL